MPKYQFGAKIVADDDSAFLVELATAHKDKNVRPKCLCQAPNPEMYVARFEDSYIIKRMPGTAVAHDSNCDHFDAPANLTGLGDVIGRAIQPQDDGKTNLKLDFSLSKLGKRAAVTPSEAKADTVKAEASKLTLLGLLHYLWHEAELDRWSPKFANRRTWHMVYSRLSEAAALKVTKKLPLVERLFVPEPYYPEKSKEIDGRRKNLLAPFKPKAGGKTDMFIVLGEFKSIEPTRFGFKLVIKHAPNFPIFMDEKVSSALRKRFGLELDMAEAHESLRIVVLATAWLNEAGSAQLAEATLMLTTKNWLPVETPEELELVSQLVDGQRSFTKGLRFNVKDRPIATAILTDLKPPCALYIQPADVDEAYSEILTELEKDSGMTAWLWDAEEGGMPDIPT